MMKRGASTTFVKFLPLVLGLLMVGRGVMVHAVKMQFLKKGSSSRVFDIKQ